MANERICTGCFHVFVGTHRLLNHRRTFRCGGEFNQFVYIPTHRYTTKGEMIYTTRPGIKYDADKLPLRDPTGSILLMDRVYPVKKRKHNSRVPGTIRASRLPGGSGFRNNWEHRDVE